MEQLLSGEGSVISIVGEAGVGKSRLIAEVRRHFLGQGEFSKRYQKILWLEGKCLSFGHSLSFLPVQEILWNYTGITEDDTNEEAWDKLLRKVQSLFTDQAESVAVFLANLLSLELKEKYRKQLEILDSGAIGKQIYYSARIFFRRLAEQNPLILVIDDLHWIDASSFSLLEHLLPLTAEVPIVICGNSRPVTGTDELSFHEIVSRDLPGNLTKITLTPLREHDAVTLLMSLLMLLQSHFPKSTI